MKMEKSIADKNREKRLKIYMYNLERSLIWTKNISSYRRERKNGNEELETKEKCAKHFVFVKTSSRSSTAAKKKSDLDEVALAQVTAEVI